MTTTATGLDFTRCTLETAKGRFSGTLREACEKQASWQAAFAAVIVSFGKDEVIQIVVDDIDFDNDNIEAAVETVRCAAIVAAEDMGLI